MPADLRHFVCCHRPFLQTFLIQKIKKDLRSARDEDLSLSLHHPCKRTIIRFPCYGGKPSEPTRLSPLGPRLGRDVRLPSTRTRLTPMPGSLKLSEETYCLRQCLFMCCSVFLFSLYFAKDCLQYKLPAAFCQGTFLFLCDLTFLQPHFRTGTCKIVTFLIAARKKASPAQ